MALHYAKRSGGPHERRLTPAAPAPYCQLSFGFEHGAVPVPGRLSPHERLGGAREALRQRRPEAFAISGDAALRALRKPPDPALGARARNTKGESFDFGYRTLSALEGRALVYAPVVREIARGGGRAALEQLVREGAKEDLKVCDDVYAPNPFDVSTPVSVARLTVDLAVGRLEPYDAAEAELLALCERRESLHDDAGTAENWAVDLEERLEQAQALRRGLRDYEAWAAAWLAEELLCLLMATVGEGVSLALGAGALSRWLSLGLVESGSLELLARRAPAARLSARWYER